MSGIRISEFKKPRTIIVDQAKVDSAYGPKSSILLESTATSYSKSGFTIEIKGLSRDSLLNGLFVTVPVQVRWVGQNGQKLLVNQFADQRGNAAAATDSGRKWALGADFFAFDGVAVRPNAFKCIRNATLSINGSSFSTRVDSYYTALCKLFADGRVEDITGCDYERYPYNNKAAVNTYDQQKGFYERCRALNNMGKIKKVSYLDAGTGLMTDIVFEYDIKFPLWFGPFTHLGFPGLTGFDGQTVSSLPYVSDLVLECTFTDDPLMDMFICHGTSSRNALAETKLGTDFATDAATDYAPNTSGMWAGAQVGDITGNTALCGLLAPKLCYMFSEPDPDKMQVAPIYTLPSYRLITYEDRKVIHAGTWTTRSPTVLVQFPYIRLSNISSLYICMAEDDRTGSGTAVAARSGKKSSGAWSAFRNGAACANRTCPIKWDTVKVNMSTSSSVLTNFVNDTITPQRQFELFKKYSNNAMSLSFEAWKESSQMLIFSAEELCGIGAFANSFQSLTLSISFEVYRTAIDTKVTLNDYLRKGEAQKADTPNATHPLVGPVQAHIDPNGPLKGNDVARAVVGRLICLEPELVSISEGAVSVEQVKLSQAEIHNQLMGGAPEVEDANKLDELAR